MIRMMTHAPFVSLEHCNALVILVTASRRPLGCLQTAHSEFKSSVKTLDIPGLSKLVDDMRGSG